MDEIEQELQKHGLADEIIWQDYEYEFYEKSRDWYWLWGIIALLIIILAVVLKDLHLALVIFLGAVIILIYSRRPPLLISFGLMKRGVKVHKNLFSYDKIKSFWVDEDKNELIIETDRLIRPHIIIPLGEASPDMIKNKLKPILKEKRYEGSLSDAIAEFFGI